MGLNNRSSGSDLNIEECGNTRIIKACPVGMIRLSNFINGEDDQDSSLVPCMGLEFDSADDAREFYSLYAMRVGFRIRTGQLYRSRTDGSVVSRRFVCSKEGNQLNSRTGCPAFIRVQRRDSGKWVIDQIHKDHNHELGHEGETSTSVVQRKTPAVRKSSREGLQRPKLNLFDGVDDGGNPCPSGVLNAKRIKRVGNDLQSIGEPYSGLVFNSADEAHQFYHIYAEKAGFRVRIGQLFRSKNDGSITSRRFVCSKEGFQHPSRVGCGAFMRIKRQESGTWIVDRLQKDHNHDLQKQRGMHMETSADLSKFTITVNGGLESLNQSEKNSTTLVKRGRQNKIKSDWYDVLLNYFQIKQTQDTGFFYSVEVENGSCMSVFWADGRCRFSCSQFGDAIVFDTSYRNTNYVVPFATFVGVNHHKRPVLLGCALIADESKESLTWLFQTWRNAMSGCRPKSIIADQDVEIQQAIDQVFPGSRHRFSMWQIKAKEQENFRSLPNEFKYEYEKFIYDSQTTVEFSTMWDALIRKYGLKDNVWLKQMYDKRESWVPLYQRGTFFAGIPINENAESFFGTFLTAQTSIREFISRYEQQLEQRREEERKEDFDTHNLQAFLQTKEPVEEQCRKLYTLAVFKIFQNELAESFNYVGMKTYEEGIISRFLVRRNGNEFDRNAVTISASNLSVSCSCQMFEFEGVLCRHILRVFNLLDIKEIPPRYILHRWTKNADYGIVTDIESGLSSEEMKTLMVWSLRETACKYIDSGSSSLVKYKLAHEILREGWKKLSWQR